MIIFIKEFIVYWGDSVYVCIYVCAYIYILINNYSNTYGKG